MFARLYLLCAAQVLAYRYNIFCNNYWLYSCPNSTGSCSLPDEVWGTVGRCAAYLN